MASPVIEEGEIVSPKGSERLPDFVPLGPHTQPPCATTPDDHAIRPNIQSLPSTPQGLAPDDRAMRPNMATDYQRNATQMGEPGHVHQHNSPNVASAVTVDSGRSHARILRFAEMEHQPYHRMEDTRERYCRYCENGTCRIHASAATERRIARRPAPYHTERSREGSASRNGSSAAPAPQHKDPPALAQPKEHSQQWIDGFNEGIRVGTALVKGILNDFGITQAHQDKK